MSWTAPDNTGRPAIESYDLRYRKGTSGDWTDGPQDVTDTAATITGLDADSEYQVQARATNSSGDGEWSAANSGSTSDGAGPVGSGTLTATVGTGKIRLEWTGSAAAYEYRRKEAGGAWSGWTEAATEGWFVLRDATTLDDYDVLAEKTYAYQVREAGASAELGEASGTLGPPITLRFGRTAYSVDEGAGELDFSILAEGPAGWAPYDREFRPSFTTGGDPVRPGGEDLAQEESRLRRDRREPALSAPRVCAGGRQVCRHEMAFRRDCRRHARRGATRRSPICCGCCARPGCRGSSSWATAAAGLT